MNHTDHLNENRTWKIRFGTGGNIYSFVSVIGELMPPQHHKSAPFIDEVWQTVTIDNILNQREKESTAYYIHQAGLYQYESILEKQPFYSPNLIKRCRDRECVFISWTQQAHGPGMTFKSKALSYNRYLDCGDGIVEVTNLIHNWNDPGKDVFNWLNVPWGGVRQSALRNVFHQKADRSGSQQVLPLTTFATGIWYPGNNIGGYTAFVQDVPEPANKPPFEMPCANAQGYKVACTGTMVRVSLVLDRDNACSAYGTGKEIICSIVKTTLLYSGCFDIQRNNGWPACYFHFSNGRNASFIVTSVSYWAGSAGTRVIFNADSVDANAINSMFKKFDHFFVSYATPPSIPLESNQALAIIYGLDTELKAPRSWTQGGSLLRCGVAGTMSTRNYVVISMIPTPLINPFQTFFKRYFAIADRFVDIDARANIFVDETKQGMFNANVPGQAVVVFSMDGLTFGADLAVNTNPPSLCASVPITCSGVTTPTNTTFPLFVVNCDSRFYLGADPYALSPDISNASAAFRPYLCSWTNTTQRPTWNFLGYFVKGTCGALQNARYDPNYCSSLAVPTAAPTADPTRAPSRKPTKAPRAKPTRRPTQSPLPKPSKSPTFLPTRKPTSAPTWRPSSTPTTLPTRKPTTTPTSKETRQPSLLPTRKPTAVPTPRPTQLPTEIPTRKSAGFTFNSRKKN